jgi:hypothetical protein
MGKYWIELLMTAMMIFSIYLLFRIRQEDERQKDRIQQEYADSIAKQKRINEFADSIGILSFYDITLGSSFNKTIKEMKKNENIYNIVVDDDRCSAHVSIILPEKNKSALMELEVISYQDTVYCINITTDEYEHSIELEKLYLSKYNSDYAVVEKKEFGAVREEECKWTLKNQTISMCTNYLLRVYTYTRDLDSEMRLFGKTKISTNVYFDNFSIQYLDTIISAKVYQMNEEKRKNEDEIYRKEMEEKKRRDSIEKSKRYKNIIQNI